MEKTISSINVRLEGLQEKLRNYKEKQIILEEDSSNPETSCRKEDPSSLRRRDEEIVFEKLTPVPSSR